MNPRFDKTFAQARGAQRTVLCPFLTAGYPHLDHLPAMLMALQQAPVGCIELGFPFSDPIADGPIIQESFRLALQRGATIRGIFAAVAQARRNGLQLPLVAMASFSILFRYGTEEFVQAAVEVGIDGLILPDVPLEEAAPIVRTAAARDLAVSLLIAPTTSPERRRRIAELCTGFVYYLSVTGITGERAQLPPDLSANLTQLRGLTQRPICVGFGISRPEQVRSLRGIADGVIVGSALIRRLQEDAAEVAPDPVRTVGALAAQLAAPLQEP